MILTAGAILWAAIAFPLPQPRPAQDQVAVVRRVATTAVLAAQEYRAGIQGGHIVAPAEVEEAKLFLAESRRTAELLPIDLGRAVTVEIDAIARLIGMTAEPDTIDARVSQLTSSLARRTGTSLDEIPNQPPSLARGAGVYQENCASCHGTLGRGDGPAAAGLDPPPADLTAYPGLEDRSPLDFFHRISIGVTGTAMPAFETRLSADDRWAASIYASILRLPPPRGEVPAALRAFATTARLSDAQLLAERSPADTGDIAVRRAWVAQVRAYQATDLSLNPTGATFSQVRSQLDSSLSFAAKGEAEAASRLAFNAYMTFEQVERSLRAKNPGLARSLEAGFAALRTRAAGGATPAELRGIRVRLAGDLENAERVISDRLSPVNLFVQSFVILLREGLEAILLIGALMTFLMKTGAGHRKRDLHIGIVAAVGASLLTALALETIFEITPAHREALEGFTMILATAMLFYVSYWLLSKMEVAKWNRFVKGKVQDALSSGSALALASVAFLAVYREGFETVLFYKALFLTGGGGSAVLPVFGGIAAGTVILLLVYLAINRYGLRIPLKPFFGVTSAFLYYMAFVFAGKGVAELQEGGLISTTVVPQAVRLPALGIYPTVESLSLQALLLLLLLVAMVWTFLIEPRRLSVTASLVPEPAGSRTGRKAAAGDANRLEPADRDMLRSLERMDADLAELRAEVERLKRMLDTKSAGRRP